MITINQSGQWPLVNFPNIPLPYLFFRESSPSPSISYFSKLKKMDKLDRRYRHKSEWINLELLMEPDIPASNYSRQFAFFYLASKYPSYFLSLILDAIPRGVDQVGDGLL
jgi:hypothetical protein